MSSTVLGGAGGDTRVHTINNPKPSFPSTTVSLLSFHWPLHYPFLCLVSHAFTPQTELNQERQPNNQLPKICGREGQLFRAKPPKKEGSIGSSCFSHTTNPTNAYMTLFQQKLWLFHSFLYTPFFLSLPSHTGKFLQQTKHLVHSNFFPAFFWNVLHF